MPGASSNLGGSLLGALLISACTGNPRTEPACDVVIISIDTVRADALTFEDRKVSPHLCDLAERGVVFDQAIAGSSWTLPSHAELFTGLPPILHGVHDDGRRIDPLHATLGERLGALGMHTAGVFSGWFLAGAYGFARGFDSYRCALADEPAADQALANALDAASAQACADGRPGAVVLFSPACASFDQFADFEVRGETFREMVVKLEQRHAEQARRHCA